MPKNIPAVTATNLTSTNQTIGSTIYPVASSTTGYGLRTNVSSAPWAQIIITKNPTTYTATGLINITNQSFPAPVLHIYGAGGGGGGAALGVHSGSPIPSLTGIWGGGGGGTGGYMENALLVPGGVIAITVVGSGGGGGASNGFGASGNNGANGGSTTVYATIRGATIKSMSSTSNTIGTGSQTYSTAPTGLAYSSTSTSIGYYVIIYNSASEYMIGNVTSYTSGTGSITINVTTAVGSGAYTSWIIYSLVQFTVGGGSFGSGGTVSGTYPQTGNPGNGGGAGTVTVVPASFGEYSSTGVAGANGTETLYTAGPSGSPSTGNGGTITSLSTVSGGNGGVSDNNAGSSGTSGNGASIVYETFA